MQGPRVAAGGRLVQLSQQGLARLLAGVVGKLDSDGLGGAQRLLPVQTFDGLLGLVSLVKPDEAHSSGYACSDSECKPMLLPWHQGPPWPTRPFNQGRTWRLSDSTEEGN